MSACRAPARPGACASHPAAASAPARLAGQARWLRLAPGRGQHMSGVTMWWGPQSYCAGTSPHGAVRRHAQTLFLHLPPLSDGSSRGGNTRCFCACRCMRCADCHPTIQPLLTPPPLQLSLSLTPLLHLLARLTVRLEGGHVVLVLIQQVLDLLAVHLQAGRQRGCEGGRTLTQQGNLPGLPIPHIC